MFVEDVALDRPLTALQGALVVVALLLAVLLVCAGVTGLRTAQELTVTCRYAYAGTTPAMRQELSRTLSWCRGTEEAK